jgi:hypothetical protein
METEWTKNDQSAAQREGWDIFDSAGSECGPWQICRLDEPMLWELAPDPYPFEEDTDVWVHVWRRADEGSALHLKALDFIKKNNPMEYAAIWDHLAVLYGEESK